MRMRNKNHFDEFASTRREFWLWKGAKRMTANAFAGPFNQIKIFKIFALLIIYFDCANELFCHSIWCRFGFSRRLAEQVELMKVLAHKKQ